MRSSALRHLVPLRLTLTGTHPPIWREVVVDHDLTLDDLRSVVQSVFSVFDCRHHVFTDSLETPGWSRTRRRWGDRWTMIDFRDPTIIDATTARVGTVLSGNEPLYFTHSCDADWLVEIERGVDDIAPASASRSRIVAGEGRSPFPCARGPYEFEVLVAILDDPDHPDHALLRACVDAALGPWGSFDSTTLDINAVQARIDAPDAASAPTTGVMTSLAGRLPRLAVPGLRAHLAFAGIDLPIVVTTADAAMLTHDFGWLINRAAREGVPLRDGRVDDAFVAEACEALGREEQPLLQLVSAARRMRLLYSRNGRLVPKKAVVAAAAAPTTLWTTLAEAVHSVAIVPSMSRDLLLLAIADGSLGREGGLRRVAAAAALADGVRRASRTGWGYDEFASRRSYSYADQDCAQGCDCPMVSGRTWHDVVAKAIRAATAAAASGGAAPVGATMEIDELEAAGVRPEWIARATTYEELNGGRPDAPYSASQGDQERDDVLAFLREAEDLIRMLSLFGLQRTATGWIVPPTLREFARAALQSAASRRYSTAF